MYREDVPSTLSAGAEQIMKNLEYFIGIVEDKKVTSQPEGAIR